MATLRYLTLPSNPSAILPQFPSYAFASRVQTALQQEFLAWKAQSVRPRGPPPPPSVLCFTPTPTYTLGRRQTEPLSESEVARLRSPLFMPGLSESEKWIANNGGNDRRGKAAFFYPNITHAPRGGLTTYHGPGQLVIWPVIDLHSPLHAHLSVRDYACLLEKTTIATLERLWGFAGFTTENPGVWVRSGGARGPDVGGDERKIAALGVHLRRHVTGLGVAINYSTPVSGPSETNPWDRIVACGLGDRGVTSVQAELGNDKGTSQNDNNTALATVGETWCSEFQKRLKLHDDVTDETIELDLAQRMASFSAQIEDWDGLVVHARPISDLEK
ncbi:hypothetical protein RRF57_012171 [Xylaria bambusicola]|uniref:Octanoyltransferase n=1 Tax=Xylaria bambusicola TaxID=326684 RepID=A0AAN7UXN3_9PEZI